jgi:DNA-directed RNA polymerase subunit RPC12/RpoP
MPQPPLKNNGHKPQSDPPESLHFERTQVKCQRCHRDFVHFMIEEIDDLAQLRCGDVLLARAEMACLHCGWIFYWNIREKDLEKMAVAYSQVLVKIGAYNPE